MAYEITIEDVKDGFSSPASDADLTAYIAIVSQADECMTQNGVPEEIGRQLKILAVRHLATTQRDGGSVTSERAVSGASRSYAEYESGNTGYKDLLRQLDRWGCVFGVVSNNGMFALRSVGRRRSRSSTH